MLQKETLEGCLCESVEQLNSPPNACFPDDFAVEGALPVGSGKLSSGEQGQILDETQTSPDLET